MTGPFEVVSGNQHCVAQGNCFHDGVGGYGNNEACEIVTTTAVKLHVVEFHTETNYDKLTVNGVQYHGKGISSGPDGVAVAAGQTITWRSDFSVSGHEGFKICTI